MTTARWVGGALCSLVFVVSAFGQTSNTDLSEAIQWRWPGAQVVVRGDVVERWDGPTARPTDDEIVQAVADYHTVKDDVRRDAAVRARLNDDRLISSVVWAVIESVNPPATRAKYDAVRSKIIDAYKARPWASRR